MIASLVMDFTLGIAGAAFDEKDALYSLRTSTKLGGTSYTGE